MGPVVEGGCDLPADAVSAVPDPGALNEHSLYACPRWLHALDLSGRRADAYLTGADEGHALGLLPLYLGSPTRNWRYSPEHLSRGFQPSDGRGWAFAVAVSAYLTEVPTTADSDPYRSVTGLLDLAAQSSERQNLSLVVPYLTTAAARYIPPTLAGRLVLEDFDCWLSTAAQDLASYRDGLSKKRAENVKRNQRMFASAGLRAEVERLQDCLTPFARLVVRSSERRGQTDDLERLVVHLTAISDVFGDDAVVFAARSQRSDLAGGVLGIMHRDVLYLRMTGFDDVATDRASAYFVLAYYAPLDLRRQRPHQTIHYGCGGLATKAFHGAELRPLWTLLPPGIAGESDMELVSTKRLQTLVEGLPALKAVELGDDVRRHYRGQQ